MEDWQRERVQKILRRHLAERVVRLVLEELEEAPYHPPKKLPPMDIRTRARANRLLERVDHATRTKTPKGDT